MGTYVLKRDERGFPMKLIFENLMYLVQLGTAFGIFYIQKDPIIY